MSVISVFRLKADNIGRKLIEDQVVYEGSLYSRVQDKEIEHKFILDYEKCDKKEAEEYKKSVIENIENKGYSEIPQITQITKYPVNIINDNEVVYISNYFHSDMPAFMISKKYPDVLIELSESVEQDFLGKSYIKNGEQVNKIGEKVMGVIEKLPKKQIVFNVNKSLDGIAKVSFPIDDTDKIFASIYVDDCNILPYREQSFEEDDYVSVTLTKPVLVYRILSDNTKSKKLMEPSDIEDGYIKAKTDYLIRTEKFPEFEDIQENNSNNEEEELEL